MKVGDKIQIIPHWEYTNDDVIKVEDSGIYTLTELHPDHKEKPEGQLRSFKLDRPPEKCRCLDISNGWQSDCYFKLVEEK